MERGRFAMSFYDVDLYQWPAEQARLLREGRIAEADIETIAEGLEDMSRGTRNELRNRLRQLLMHLLKYEFQPAKRTQSWLTTIANQRADIGGLLKDNPSLRPTIPELIRETCWPDAVATASIETGLARSIFPVECSYSQQQILDLEFLPEPKEQ
jgi:hypothetical protein